ncbi:hypothetical protein ACXYFN_03630 [Mycoplasma sp. 48589B]
MPLSKALWYYWVPIWVQYFVGLFLSIDITTLTLYFCNKGQSFWYASVVFSSIIGFLFLIYITNWTFNFKGIFRVDAIPYDWNKENTYKKHPFWKSIKSFLFYYEKYDQTNKDEDNNEQKELNIGTFDKTQLRNYFMYKERINTKKIFKLMNFLPFLLGFWFGILICFIITLITLTHSPKMHLFRIFIALFVVTFCVVSLCILNICKSIFVDMFLEIFLNKACDIDENEKIQMYFNDSKAKERLETYSKTINRADYKNSAIIKSNNKV